MLWNILIIGLLASTAFMLKTKKMSGGAYAAIALPFYLFWPTLIITIKIATNAQF